MEDVTYKVFLVLGAEPLVYFADPAVEDIEGAVEIGEVNHPHATQDELGDSENHVLYHHIREMFYHVKPNGEPGFWPNNLKNIQDIQIKQYVASEPDPVDP